MPPTAPRERIVLVDANALFTAARLKLDLVDELRAVAPGWVAVVPASVVRELKAVSTRTRGAEAIALASRLPVLENEGRGDGAILQAASAGPRRAVLTNDRALRRALRARKVPVIFVRGAAVLALDGAL